MIEKSSKGLLSIVLSALIACFIFTMVMSVNCAATVTDVSFAQIDWFGLQASPINDSEWGEFTVDVTANTTTEYVNVIANNGSGSDQWIVRNLPILEESSSSGTYTLSTKFDLGLLGVSRGTDVSSLNYFMAVTSTPLTGAPSGTTSPAPVGYINFDAEGREGGPHTDPGSPADLSSLNFNIGIFKAVWYPGMENIEAADSECGPAAATNSMRWLDKTYGLKLNKPANQIKSEMNSVMSRNPCEGVTDNQFLTGKLKFIKDNKLPIEVHFQDDGLGGGNFVTPHGTATGQGTKPTFEWIERELDKGQDVELGMTYYNNTTGKIEGGHWVTLSGKIDFGFGFAQGVFYRHDTKQADNNKGTKGTHFGWLVKRPDGFIRLTSEANNKVDIVVAESPKPIDAPALTPPGFLLLVLSLLGLGAIVMRKMDKR